MPHSFRPSSGWGPARNRAAVSITLDNLGEAAELELGLWEGQPVGAHHTAAFIPRLIEVLGNVRATYFIEAINTQSYPEAIRTWNAAGHEVAIHAWRHEVWENCPAERRRELLGRSIAAMQSLGIEPVGFRPPGGAIPQEAWAEFAQAGLFYCSELGAPGINRIEGVVSVPFQWPAVDVYMIEEVMAFMRQRLGDQQAPYRLDEWQAALDRLVVEVEAEGSHRVVIFHPNFLGQSEAKLDVLRHLITTLKRRDIWVAPVRDVARFVAAALDTAAMQAA